MAKSQGSRLRELDVFRAVAVLLVIGYHYFARWTPPRAPHSLYPFGSLLADFPPFRFGYLGVHFFFIISGFAIAMTLTTCRTPVEFGVRRLARLLPAMVVCSLITMLWQGALLPTPEFRPFAHPLNLLPSWTFSEPAWWAELLGHPSIAHIDGAYWSLVVEAKFYICAAAIYFLAKRHFLPGLLVFSLAAWLTYVLGVTLNSVDLLDFAKLSFGRFALLFAAGVVFQHMHATGDRRPVVLAVLAATFVGSVITVFVATGAAKSKLGEIAFISLFYAAFLGLVLGWRMPRGKVLDALSRIGLISYPLYLLHQNIGVSVLSHLPGELPLYAQLAAVALLVAALVWVSDLIHRHIELPGKQLIVSTLRQ